MRWEIYKDNSGKWRWRKIDSVGRVIIKSKDGFVFKTECVREAIWKGYTP